MINDKYISSDRFRRVCELKKFFSMLYFDISRGSLNDCPCWTDNLFTPADCTRLYQESPVYRELLTKFEEASKSEIGEAFALMACEMFETIEAFVNEVVEAD
jgi:hypothetical protein